MEIFLEDVYNHFGFVCGGCVKIPLLDSNNATYLLVYYNV